MFIVFILQHCNISPSHVTSMTTQAVSTHRIAPLARAVAFLLLVFVTHSTTAAVAHRHGNLLPEGSAGVTTIGAANTDHSTTEGSRPTGECLICQLHQNLFSTLLVSIPGIAAPQAEEAHARKTFVSFLSETHAPRRGRAPPQTSLL